MTNPLLSSWASEPFHMPPFAEIKPEHYLPAFEKGCKDHLDELQKIVDSKEPINFENVMASFDRSGSLVNRVGHVFYNMCGSANSEALQAVQTEMAPIMSRHKTSTFTFPGLFDKIKTVYDTRNNSELKLNSEQIRLCERLYFDFTRSGAAFSAEAKKEYGDILVELAGLETQFQQNVMKDEELTFIVLKKGDDLKGLPDELIDAARQAAAERSRDDDEYVITLSRSLVEPFLTFSERRDLREQAFRLWTRRGELDDSRDNKTITEKILKLRQKQASMHGYPTFADYQTADTMAKTPSNVNNLLTRVWERAKVSADKEREALEEYVASCGEPLDQGIQAWDWRYFAERVRQKKYNFDEGELKPYLSLDKVTEAVMAVSNRLYGLEYTPRPDLQSYHPDVKTYEVHEKQPDGTKKLIAIFLHDNYARPMKSSGAWMSELRSQSKNLAQDAAEMEAVPLVMNNNNFARGNPTTLLSFDDAITLFHEMGHGHHGMLSNCTYNRLASTNVLTDFVELPSQLMEHFLKRPEVLKEYAKHYETNESVPDDLLARRKAASSFNQGFDTIEYTACALLDMLMHSIEDYNNFDMKEFEERELARLGMPQGIVMRHRPTHFQHLFSGSHYAASYYVYLWAEVLDADAFAAFEEAEGGIFDKSVSSKARQHIYSAGNTVAPDELFRRFRGRDPDIQFMLKKKGLE
jgi:peptidyl-dipeptidase Dcp